MCRMLGITNFDYDKHSELLRNFFKLAETGKTLKGDSCGHLDGWGIGWYKNSRAFIHKSGKPITKEKDAYFGLLEKIGRSLVLIAHLRKSAYSDPNTKKDAHPFKYKNVIFAHNGTICDYEKLIGQISPQDKPPYKALDSEIYARFIISRSARNLKKKLSEAVSFIRENNKYSSLTCLLTDGKTLYAYREFTKSPEYYTLYRARSGKSNIISSEPVSDKLDWEALSLTKILSISTP